MSVRQGWLGRRRLDTLDLNSLGVVRNSNGNSNNINNMQAN